MANPTKPEAALAAAEAEALRLRADADRLRSEMEGAEAALDRAAEAREAAAEEPDDVLDRLDDEITAARTRLDRAIERHARADQRATEAAQAAEKARKALALSQMPEFISAARAAFAKRHADIAKMILDLIADSEAMNVEFQDLARRAGIANPEHLEVVARRRPWGAAQELGSETVELNPLSNGACLIDGKPFVERRFKEAETQRSRVQRISYIDPVSGLNETVTLASRLTLPGLGGGHDPIWKAREGDRPGVDPSRIAWARKELAIQLREMLAEERADRDHIVKTRDVPIP